VKRSLGHAPAHARRAEAAALAREGDAQLVAAAAARRPHEALREVAADGKAAELAWDAVVERIAGTRGLERRRIEDTLRRIDVANGDINDFLRHLAEGLARQYDFASDWNDDGDDDDVKRWTPSR